MLSTDAGEMAAVADRFDLIIDTVPYVHDVNPYIPTLAVSGTLVLVGYLGPLEPALNTVSAGDAQKSGGRLADRRHPRNAGNAGFLR